MKKEILIAIVSALIGGLISVILSSTFGLFDKALDKQQAKLVVHELLAEEVLRKTLFDGAAEAMVQNYSDKLFRSGMVIAFNGSECPIGWRPLTELYGRVLVGAGAGDNRVPRSFTDRGGNEVATLFEKHLPSHKHRFKDNFYHDEAPRHVNHANQSSDESGGLTSINAETDLSGFGESFEIMPPYYAMPYCVKE